ncbi:hypothetical protein BDZ89DRAFT_1094033 [Hymenopellis radicata]|nr:hypothetical protein BDZ89DRAFT_1094033 [Hymenopellis radicata]
MDTTSTAFGGSQTESKKSCDLEDWMDLKDLFDKAAEQYETGSASDALPLLRGVIHECHSFLNFYQDPSILFAAPKTTDAATATATTPAEEKPKQPWDLPLQKPKPCTCVELPTAFHAILGTALFLFGNLIDQDGSLALTGEPDTPIPYWLAALDVFETGDNLPSLVNGTGCDAPEDWRMAIIWGRTLVAIADATISRDPTNTDCVADFCADEPAWPLESPFAAIAMRRPPLTRRMTLSNATPNHLMMLAMDQFSRGIFHMPHPQHLRHSVVRKELYTIASEVMLLSEKLPRASERQFWASWADSVLNQMKMEADMEAWRSIISRARGKYRGSLEAEDYGVLNTEEADDAREDLQKAIAFLEKGRGQQGEEEEERRRNLAEALCSLGNLTPDEVVREALYRRAGEETGEDLMDVD